MKLRFPCIIFLFASLWTISVQCEKQDPSLDQRTPIDTDTDTLATNPSDDLFQLNPDSQAIVTAVTTSGSENNYTFNVTIESPDLGCNQYADWWEVFTPDSTLIYRRILTHSHVTEQPFTRSGGTVKISASQQVFVRGHMNNLGYGSLIFSGSVQDGFVPDSIPDDFASGLRSEDPLPTSCAF